jgi:hypothetical protein
MVSIPLTIPPIPSSWKLLALFAAGFLAACVPEAPEQPASPFFGDWTTAEGDGVGFRAATLVQNRSDGTTVTLGSDTCDGAFRFAYGERSRAELMRQAGQLRDVRQALDRLLTYPSYEVAELTCGSGTQTYVLLDEARLVAIYRVEDIARLEPLSRRIAAPTARQ